MPISDHRRRDLTAQEAMELSKILHSIDDFLYSPLESLKLLSFDDLMGIFIEITSTIRLLISDVDLKSRATNNPELKIGETEIFRPSVTVSVGTVGAKAKLRQCAIPAGNESRTIKDRPGPLSGNVSDAIIFFESLAQLGILIRKEGLKNFDLDSFMVVMGYPSRINRESGGPRTVNPLQTPRMMRKRLNELSSILRRNSGNLKKLKLRPRSKKSS